MAFSFTSMLVWIVVVGTLVSQRTNATTVGINYGRIANNLPPPTVVVAHLQSLGFTMVKLYDADSEVLRAFSNSNIDLGVTVPNNNLPDLATDQAKADQWVQKYLLPFLPQTKITTINAGNEVYATNDTTLISSLLPAMELLHRSLVAIGLDKQVSVSTPHMFNIMANSFPPSAGKFRQDLAGYIKPLLDFLSRTHSPFLINIYPFFAYSGEPQPQKLLYSTFQTNNGVIDPKTNHVYDNMLYAQIDAVYAAMSAMGYNNIRVVVAETGWPSKGDAREAGATVENAAVYNENILKRLAMNQGTPAKPSMPVEVYLFALFNENMKQGPTSERNYGLFYPNTQPVYQLAFEGAPVVDRPVANSPPVYSPVADPPDVHSPPVSSPVADPPIVVSPAIHSPIVDPPVGESPTIHFPVVDPDVIDSPFVDPPVVSPAVDSQFDAPALPPGLHSGSSKLMTLTVLELGLLASLVFAIL